MTRLLAAGLALAGLGLWLGRIDCARGADFATLDTAEPRAFGYQVGDIVERRLALHVPAGLALDAGSLPRAGTRGRALELRAVADGVHRDAGGGQRHDIRLTYQVFLSPREVRTLEMPAFSLRLQTPPGAPPQSVRVDAWPLTVSPLAPVDPSPRRGLGELRPDVAPPLIDTAGVRGRLAAYAAAGALLLAYLAHVYLALPWWAARRRPLTLAAWRLRRLSAGQAPEALRTLHAALNATAGEVLFARALPAFIAARPRFGALAADLEGFFVRSGAVFFSAEAAPADLLPWLQQLAARLSAAERGAA